MLPLDDVLLAYASGWFPMADEDGQIRWYSPDPRGVIPLDALHVPKRLARTLRSGVFDVRFDTAFEDVIRACAEDRDEGTWISDEIIDTYVALHNRGFAHSVEVWQDGRLVGGLYGVALGAAFFGESMFADRRDASKVALVRAVRWLAGRGIALVDCQVRTEHLVSLGAREIPRSAFLDRLRHALEAPTLRGPWTLDLPPDPAG